MRAARLFAFALLSLIPAALLFLVSPSLGIALALAPTTSRPLGIPLALLLGAVALYGLVELVSLLRDGLGLRVVTRLERPHPDVPSTLLSGRRVAANLRRLDALASAHQLPSPSALGVASGGRAPFLDGEQLLPTLDALVDATGDPELRLELAQLAGAARAAAAARVRIRLELMTVSGMNAALYADLRARGL